MEYYWYNESLMRDWGYFTVLCRQLDNRYKFNQGDKYLLDICKLISNNYETDVCVYECFEQFKRNILKRAKDLNYEKENYLDLYLDNVLYRRAFEDVKTNAELDAEKKVVKDFLIKPRSNNTKIGALYIIRRLRLNMFYNENINVPDYDFLESAKKVVHYIIKNDPNYNN